ncbi:MAG: hypothetical protein IKY41_07875 [Clostridia bacterium]|nr:hypothetical protein [Clostridia bacterium]
MSSITHFGGKKAVNRIISEYKRLVTKEKDVLLNIYDLLIVGLDNKGKRTIFYKFEREESR